MANECDGDLGSVASVAGRKRYEVEQALRLAAFRG